MFPCEMARLIAAGPRQGKDFRLIPIRTRTEQGRPDRKVLPALFISILKRSAGTFSPRLVVPDAAAVPDAAEVPDGQRAPAVAAGRLSVGPPAAAAGRCAGVAEPPAEPSAEVEARRAAVWTSEAQGAAAARHATVGVRAASPLPEAAAAGLGAATG